MSTKAQIMTEMKACNQSRKKTGQTNAPNAVDEEDIQTQLNAANDSDSDLSGLYTPHVTAAIN
jgi:hypothetical protein